MNMFILSQVYNMLHEDQLAWFLIGPFIYEVSWSECLYDYKKMLSQAQSTWSMSMFGLQPNISLFSLRGQGSFSDWVQNEMNECVMAYLHTRALRDTSLPNSFPQCSKEEKLGFV